MQSQTNLTTESSESIIAVPNQIELICKGTTLSCPYLKLIQFKELIVATESHLSAQRIASPSHPIW